MAELVLQGLTKRYAGHDAVAGVDLRVASGEFVSLLGPSGCGKSTLLRMVAGLIQPTAGRITLGNADITRVPTHRRGLGLVFQSYALFPHMTVAGNVGYGLRRQGVRGAELARRVAEALALVRLGHLADRTPRQLSGGQQQRVALARAVAPRPRVLLLDEPLSNLDALLRDEMQIEIKRLQQQLGITSVFVTHDQAEALSLSDRVCVLADGKLQQVGTPEDVYSRPANGFVAGFIGRSNRLPAVVETANGAGSVVRLLNGPALRSGSTGHKPGASVEAIIRNDAPRLCHHGEGLPGEIVLRSFFGAQVQLVVRLAPGLDLVTECATASPQAALPVGAAVRVQLDPADVFVADAIPA